MKEKSTSWALGHVWPSIADFGRALGEPDPTVRAWFAQGRQIPPSRFRQIIDAAREKGEPLTYEALEAINAKARASDTNNGEAAA